jgi:hypothetical protein
LLHSQCLPIADGGYRQAISNEASMGSNRVEHRGQLARYAQALIAMLLLGLFAGCGSNAQTADMSGSGSTPTVTASPRDDETQTTAAAASWVTYTNTKYGYTIQYPTEWFHSDTSPTAEFSIFSYDPSKISGYPLPPGATKIEILVYPNPSQLSPADVLQQPLDQRTQRGEPVGTITKLSVTVAGRASLEVIEGPHGGNVFGGYTITYMIPHGGIMLWLGQYGLPNGTPSAILTYMVQSLALTSA